jgi:electron transfer flavoprotein alpha subunit
VQDDLASLGKYGVKKVHHVADAKLDHLDAQVFTKVIAQVVESTSATVVIFSNNVDGKCNCSAPFSTIKSGLVSGAIALPDTSNGFVVKKNVFSGKAFC